MLNTQNCSWNCSRQSPFTKTGRRANSASNLEWRKGGCEGTGGYLETDVEEERGSGVVAAHFDDDQGFGCGRKRLHAERSETVGRVQRDHAHRPVRQTDCQEARPLLACRHLRKTHAQNFARHLLPLRVLVQLTRLNQNSALRSSLRKRCTPSQPASQY